MGQSAVDFVIEKGNGTIVISDDDEDDDGNDGDEMEQEENISELPSTGTQIEELFGDSSLDEGLNEDPLHKEWNNPVV